MADFLPELLYDLKKSHHTRISIGIRNGSVYLTK